MEGFKQQEYSPIEKKYSTLIESELKSPRVVEAQHKILEIFVKKPELITAILESFGDSEFMKRWNEGRRGLSELSNNTNWENIAINSLLDIILDATDSLDPMHKNRDQKEFLEYFFILITYLTEYNNIPNEVIEMIEKFPDMNEGNMLRKLLHSNPHLSKEK